ncbi:2Fe-2S ferredoxin [Chromobacterium violaceum]|uniref:(2Fe-2S) ferredoxin domain-containing protein n=1 Tax=Chromobacterium violaceum TaxID=536 RepID=UPI0006545924|nr:NAD(P)H-dependent oxidoreductase subunit E [Chromobacterium violaceum]KMN49248.1 2Fe-2S ferredoxin [Chromobacterium violaceum]KMN87974.1 2Fe-2S ferredoxin [Chromobacterium violaceum]KMN91301.1 2Fe-2S ferredoxin [Chromobacterium violaceum]KMO04341.1 2Fe-2S ferredoxin [Chromobacterium violaceum]
MSFFDKHVFICCNQRDACQDCCNNHGSSALLGYMKDKVKALGLAGEGKIRVNKAGCLGRCDEGPVMVVYPEETWYTFVDKDDIDEIVSEHMVHGRVVERLKI